MHTSSNSTAGQQASLGLDCEALLQSEIEFWQEVIATCPATQSEESLERMRQALALARTRLESITGVSSTVLFPSFRKQ